MRGLLLKEGKNAATVCILFCFILGSLDPCMDDKEWSFLEHLFMVAIIVRSLHSHPSPSRP